MIERRNNRTIARQNNRTTEQQNNKTEQQNRTIEQINRMIERPLITLKRRENTRNGDEAGGEKET